MPLIEDDDDVIVARAIDEQANNDEGREDENDALEIRELIASATSRPPRPQHVSKEPNNHNNNDHQDELYQQFKDRMSSFTLAKYFAMPLQVSPLVCAVTGWKMKENSTLLICAHCGKLLSIKVPIELSCSAKRKLCEIYQGHLWETHAEHCPFRPHAKRFLHHLLVRSSNNQDEKNNKERDKDMIDFPLMILPTSLTRLLPPNDPAIMSLECSFPRAAFRARIETLATIIPDLREVPVHVPAGVTLYRADDDDLEGAGTTPSPASLVRRIVSCCNMETTNANTTAAALALLGWNGRYDNQGIECTLCLAQRSFHESTTTTDGGSKPVSPYNRSRWNHAFDAHRYFCPWVCGLSGDVSSPLWKCLADRLLDDVQQVSSSASSKSNHGTTTDLASNDPTDSSGELSELRKLLDTGVSRKRLKRSTSWNVDKNL